MAFVEISLSEPLSFPSIFEDPVLELEKHSEGPFKSNSDRSIFGALSGLYNDTLVANLSSLLEAATENLFQEVRIADLPKQIFFVFDGNFLNDSIFGSRLIIVLQTRYFASSNFGRFLTPRTPVSSASYDQTQSTISTTCTTWLSAVGSLVGLPKFGFKLSQVR